MSSKLTLSSQILLKKTTKVLEKRAQLWRNLNTTGAEKLGLSTLFSIMSAG